MLLRVALAPGLHRLFPSLPLPVLTMTQCYACSDVNRSWPFNQSLVKLWFASWFASLGSVTLVGSENATCWLKVNERRENFHGGRIGSAPYPTNGPPLWTPEPETIASYYLVVKMVLVAVPILGKGSHLYPWTGNQTSIGFTYIPPCDLSALVDFQISAGDWWCRGYE